MAVGDAGLARAAAESALKYSSHKSRQMNGPVMNNS